MVNINTNEKHTQFYTLYMQITQYTPILLLQG